METAYFAIVHVRNIGANTMVTMGARTTPKPPEHKDRADLNEIQGGLLQRFSG